MKFEMLDVMVVDLADPTLMASDDYCHPLWKSKSCITHTMVWC